MSQFSYYLLSRRRIRWSPSLREGGPRWPKSPSTDPRMIAEAFRNFSRSYKIDLTKNSRPRHGSVGEDDDPIASPIGIGRTRSCTKGTGALRVIRYHYDSPEERSKDHIPRSLKHGCGRASQHSPSGANNPSAIFIIGLIQEVIFARNIPADSNVSRRIRQPDCGSH